MLFIGDFEVFFVFLSLIVLGIIIYNIINVFAVRSLIKRFGLLKLNRRDYYECGFKPQKQKPIQLPIQFLLISIFFLLYDIELIFSFPYVSNIKISGAYDFWLMVLFIYLFVLSLLIDTNRHALYWQY